MKIHAISISDRKGIRKKNVDTIRLIEGFGLENDAHGGDWHRQVSLLAQESIDTMRAKGLDVVAGNFAENITTSGIILDQLSVGDHIALGSTELIISQLGKVCHHKCAIFHQAGDCVMPREGIFGVVVKGGEIAVGDPVRLLSERSTSAAIVTTQEVADDTLAMLTRKIEALWSPAFIRHDMVNAEKSPINAILDDLTGLQKITRILIFDPSGREQLCLFGMHSTSAQQTGETGNIQIEYCKSLADVEALSS